MGVCSYSDNKINSQNNKNNLVGFGTGGGKKKNTEGQTSRLSSCEKINDKKQIQSYSSFYSNENKVKNNKEQTHPLYSNEKKNNKEQTQASPPPAAKINSKNDDINYPNLSELEGKNKENNFEKDQHNKQNIQQNKRNKLIDQNEYQQFDDKYDIIIDASSIRYLNKGWNIVYNRNEELIKELIENLDKIIITVLGNSNRGKTHILQKLSGTKLPAGYQIQTKGLSIKIYDKEKVLLDTAGTNAPLLIEDNNSKRPSQKEIDNIYLCQVITNFILQTFVINISNIIICVVGMLTASEQQFINKIKNICKNKKKLIIIHNLIKCKSYDDIEKYAEEILFKNITCELEAVDIPNIDDKLINNFQRYYKEKTNNNVFHFIYGSDERNSEEMNYYNDTTLNFINKKIKVEQKEKINIIERLVEHVREISSYSLTKELKSITKNNELNLIQCEEQDIEPKRICADEFDNLIFVGKDFEPIHRCYVQDKFFIIEIDICSEYKDLSVDKAFEMSTKEDVFKISGERVIKDTMDDDRIKYDFVDKRETYKKFKLEIKIKKSDYNISNIKNEYTEFMEYGILFLTFNLSFKNKKKN